MDREETQQRYDSDEIDPVAQKPAEKPAEKPRGEESHQEKSAEPQQQRYDSDEVEPVAQKPAEKPQGEESHQEKSAEPPQQRYDSDEVEPVVQKPAEKPAENPQQRYDADVLAPIAEKPAEKPAEIPQQKPAEKSQGEKKKPQPVIRVAAPVDDATRLNLSEAYFHGTITEEQADELLRTSGSPFGTFLARNSRSEPASCIIFSRIDEKKRIIHTRLFKLANGKWSLSKTPEQDKKKVYNKYEDLFKDFPKELAHPLPLSRSPYSSEF